MFLCLGLAGCAYVSPNPAATKLPDKSGAVLPGQSNGESVRKTLGSPIITSRYWGVEVFRDASSQVEVPLAVIAPTGWMKDAIFRYTLVVYDTNGVAESTATGIHRKPSGWRTASPIEYGNLTLQMQAGDYTFVCEWEDRHETLLVSPARRNVYLEQARRSSQATVVIGCGIGECASKLRVDNGPTLPLPCRLKAQNLDAKARALLREGKQEEYDKAYPTKTYETVAALSLAPGNHTLKAWGGRWQRDKLAGLFSGEHSVTISCEAGEILYVVIDVSAKEYSWSGANDVEWRIEQHKEMPEFFGNRQFLLYRGGQWFAQPQPTN
jgi:hypothetical protein